MRSTLLLTALGSALVSASFVLLLTPLGALRNMPPITLPVLQTVISTPAPTATVAHLETPTPNVILVEVPVERTVIVEVPVTVVVPVQVLVTATPATSATAPTVQGSIGSFAAQAQVAPRAPLRPAAQSKPISAPQPVEQIAATNATLRGSPTTPVTSTSGVADQLSVQRAARVNDLQAHQAQPEILQAAPTAIVAKAVQPVRR